MKSAILALALGLSALTFAQNGQWDKERAFLHAFKLKASGRHIVKTTAMPEGTTEIVFRMTVLDDNQQLSSNLVSLLKSIPDPTAVSQGSAAAVFLASKIAGDDKNRFAIFTSEESAKKYAEGGVLAGACYAQNVPVNKEVRLLSSGAACTRTQVLYFVFESANRLMAQNVVLEIVPWVDAKQARGWKAENKQSVLDLCETSALAKLMTRPDDLCLCILDHLSKAYTWPEYQALLPAEKSKRYRDMGNRCLDAQTGDKSVQQTLRSQASDHFAQGRYDKAIGLLESGIFAHNTQTARDELEMSRYLLFSRQYERARPYLERAEKAGADFLEVQMIQAHLHLLEGDFSKARAIHRKFLNQGVSTEHSWRDRALSDLNRLETEGHRADYSRIRKILTDD